MKYDSYQHVGHKTFFVNLLKNGIPAILIALVWFGIVTLKIIGVENIFSSLVTPDSMPFLGIALNWALLGGFIFIIISIALAIFITSIDYFTFSFMLDEHGLCLKQGLLYKEEMSIPYRQIQDINISRPFVYQILGVCKLNILTAGQDSDYDNDPTEANFPIVDKNLAYDLREQLLEHSNIQLVSSPVEHPNVPLNKI